MFVATSLSGSSQKANYCLCTHIYFTIHKSNMNLLKSANDQFKLNQCTCLCMYVYICVCQHMCLNQNLNLIWSN